ncbi:MAG: RagB/SusD family nutrient uptake outer membrane protein [Odoribacteraceae bacterium]|jgi:hypothetical protein|nr:RagB/SusD family nutrient uptake outer membrane protein [Odoribacteraceae bacterium]
MKRYRLIALLLLVTTAWSCNKFLEEYSLNELRPGSVIDLQQLMIGEAYPVTGFFAPYLELLTDNVTSNFPTRSIEQQVVLLMKGEGPFLWRHDMFESMQERGIANANSYELYYRRIMVCNVVLDNLEEVVGSREEKDKLKGEALALRSYCYFMLVNLYGQPYNAPGVDANTSPGVPLILASAVKDEYPTRVPVATVYKQIEKDLLDAEVLLAELGKENSKWRVTDLFVYTLLSRVYLYEERWDESIAYATKLLQRSPALLDLSKLTNASNNYPTTNAFTSNVYDLNNAELIWGFSSSLEHSFSFNATMTPAYSRTAPAPYAVSANLLACYEYDDVSTTNRKDLRPHFYYIGYGAMASRYRVSNLKIIREGGSGPTKGMRVAEAYLNRAESNARLFLETGNDARRLAALADLNYLREHRYDKRNVAYVPVEITAADELIQFCLDERRRELSYEEHRWFDLRRAGMPKIIHEFKFIAEQNPVIDSLVQGDERYVLPIPAVALSKNPALVPNPSNTPR